MSGYEEPNYTQTPNAFLDSIMPQIETVAELKVTLAIVRQTFGYHRNEDELSFSRLENLTGLRREGVSDGIRRALKRGSISRRKKGNTYLYRLKVVGKPDYSEEGNGRQTGLETVGKPDCQMVGKPDSQKKVPKEKERKNSPRGDYPAKTLTTMTVERTREVGFEASRGQIENWGSGWAKFVYVGEDEEPPPPERQHAVLNEIVAAAAGRVGKTRFFLSVPDAVKRIDGATPSDKGRDSPAPPETPMTKEDAAARRKEGYEWLFGETG